MPTGYISYISDTGHYGFIDSPDLDIDHIFFHISNCKKKYKYLFKGDKISFEYNPEIDFESGAKDISFLKNASLEGLKKDYEKGHLLKGFLKKINGRYYVKDRDTHIFIQLIVASYEINLEEVYEYNLNKLIDYKIVTYTSINKIRAINVNRQFLPNCKLLVKGNITEGQVMASVKGGYQIKIYDDILGFLPKSLADKSKTILEEGEMVNVICINTGENLENVLFDLRENRDKEYNLKILQEKFMAKLKPGDKYQGKVINVVNFGIFINLGVSDGLMHISNLLGEPTSNLLEKPFRNQFTKILKQVFTKELEIEVIVEAILSDDRISLTWEYATEPNCSLHNIIYTHYKSFALQSLNPE